MCSLKEFYNAIYEVVLPKKKKEKGDGDKKGRKEKP